ncbi:MAG: hypothetical protein CMJ32_08155 [Phycisphaerae bacterium]|nr:hypothetical protein [Phycisphaerae bacterium]
MINDWNNAEDHVDRALEFYQRGRWPEAEAELRKALEFDPDRGDWQFNLGLTLEAAGRDAESYEAYRIAVDLLPDEAEPFIAVGVLANRLGKHEESVRWLEIAIKKDPTSEASFSHLIDAYTNLDRLEDAETTYFLAQQSLEELPNCLAAMGESLLKRGELKRAGWCYREALRQDPEIPGVRARLARILAAHGKVERAMQMYLQELRQDPGSIDTLIDFGDLLMSQERIAEASEKYRRVLEIEPANTDAHFRLGQVAILQSNIQQAHLEYELILKLCPDFPLIRIHLADCLVQLDRVPEARRHLDEQLTNDPDTLRLPDRYTLGCLLVASGMFLEAVPVLQSIVETDPGDVEAWRKLARAQFECSEHDKAICSCHKVLAMDPTCASSHHNLALASLESGRPAEAFHWVRKGLAHSPHDQGLRILRMRTAYACFRSFVLRLVGRGVEEK